MRAHFVIGAVGVAVLGASVASQQNRHLNPMVDLLSAKKAIYGLGVPTAGARRRQSRRTGAPAAGGDRRGGSTDAAPATPPPPPQDAARTREGCAGASGSRLLLHRDDGAQHRRRLRDDDRVAGRAGRSRQRRQVAVLRACSCRSTRRRRTSRAPTCRPIRPTTSTNISRQLNAGVVEHCRSSKSTTPKSFAWASPRCASSPRAARGRTMSATRRSTGA